MSKKHTDTQTIFFIIVLCLICGLLLAVVAYSLQGPQEKAKSFDRSKQMLIAAKILDHEGYFILLDEKSGQTKRAEFKDGFLVADENAKKASDEQIASLAEKRIRPLLTDAAGKVYTLEEKNIVLSQYLEESKKVGYAKLPNKLFYAVLPNKSEMSEKELASSLKDVYAIVIPVSGFGLWAPIYGYIALESNGDTVIGTTWYEMGETPGLGANITEGWWQNQFFGKMIFRTAGSGKPDYQTADIGIIVVKGKVSDVFGNSPRAKSAVDGISGATLTGDGVTAAYTDSLTPYRNFFIGLQSEQNARSS